MDLKDIQELIKFVAKSGATEVDLEIDNVKFQLNLQQKRKEVRLMKITTIIQQPCTSCSSTISGSYQLQYLQATPAADDESNYITIKASMIGTFYRSASPENPPFVRSW